MSDTELNIENTFLVVRPRRTGNLRSVNTLPLNLTSSADQSRCVKISRLPLDLKRDEIRANFDYAESIFIPFDLLKRNHHHGVAILTFASQAAAILFMQDEYFHKISCNNSLHFFSVEWGNRSRVQPSKSSSAIEVLEKVFVGGLKREIDESIIREYFAKFGVIKSVEIIKDNRSGRSKGFAFLEFAFPVNSDLLCQSHCLRDKRISVRPYFYSL